MVSREHVRGKDETCPLSTGGRTRRVQLVRGEGVGGGSRDRGACRFDFYDEDSSGTLDKTEVFRGIVQAQSHPLAYRGRPRAAKHVDHSWRALRNALTAALSPQTFKLSEDLQRLEMIIEVSVQQHGAIRI